MRDLKEEENNKEEKKQNDEKKKKVVSHHIILIRHGQYEQNNGDSDEKRVLTPLGREQARLTGKRLKELSDAKVIHPIKYIYYSTMTRATETHNLIMESLHDEPILKHNIQPCSMIKEGAVCRPDPKHNTWLPTVEDFSKDGARVDAGFLNHIHRASEDEGMKYTTVLVCHGNVIRYYMLKALQLPTNAWLRTSVANSSISMLSISPNGNVSCRNFGDSGHLPPNKVTFN
jgi:serine/threonine-protein phosphatase PGAM5